MIITTTLNDDVLQNKSELISSIVATREGHPNVGKSILVVELPKKSKPDIGLQFSASAYKGQYKEVDGKNDTYEVSLDENIVVTSNTKTDKIMMNLTCKGE